MMTWLSSGRGDPNPHNSVTAGQPLVDGSGFDRPAIEGYEPPAVLQTGHDIEQKMIARPEILKDRLNLCVGLWPIEINHAVHVITDSCDIGTGIDQRFYELRHVCGCFQFCHGSPISF